MPPQRVINPPCMKKTRLISGIVAPRLCRVLMLLFLSRIIMMMLPMRLNNAMMSTRVKMR